MSSICVGYLYDQPVLPAVVVSSNVHAAGMIAEWQERARVSLQTILDVPGSLTPAAREAMCALWPDLMVTDGNVAVVRPDRIVTPSHILEYETVPVHIPLEKPEPVILPGAIYQSNQARLYIRDTFRHWFYHNLRSVPHSVIAAVYAPREGGSVRISQVLVEHLKTIRANFVSYSGEMIGFLPIDSGPGEEDYYHWKMAVLDWLIPWLEHALTIEVPSYPLYLFFEEFPYSDHY